MSAALDAALDLARRGYRVFPVRLSWNARSEKWEKKPLTEHWRLDASTDEAQIRQWWKNTPGPGIGVATGNGLMVVDLDLKNGIDGLARLQELEMAHSECPDGPRVRTISGGLHLWFRVTGEVRNSGGTVASGIDVRGDGGFVVVPPTTGANGKGYSWDVDLDDCGPPPAPDWLVALARGGQKKSDGDGRHRGNDYAETLMAAAVANDGRWHESVLHLVAHLVGKRTPNAVILALADHLTCHGHTVEETRADLQGMVEGAIEKGWVPGVNDRSSGKATLRIVDPVPEREEACGAIQLPIEPCIAPNLPDEFWNSSELLQEIRAYAHSRYASADAVLAEILARAAAYAPVPTHIETIISEKTSLNFLSSIIGESESGKTVAASVGRDLVSAPNLGDIDFIIGSGAGIAEAFMGEEERPPPPGEKKPVIVRCQTRWNAFFHADEGKDFLAKLARPEETLGAVLCSAFNGEPVGAKLATKDRNRMARRYNLGFRANFQPSVIAPLAQQFGIGLPARFLYLSANDPYGEVGKPAEAPIINLSPVGILTCAPVIREETHERREKSLKGKIIAAPFEKHYIVMLYKIAGLLCFIHGDYYVSDHYWRLAKMVWETSCGVRDFALDATEKAQEEEREERVNASILFKKAGDEADAGIERIAERIRKYLADHPGATNRELRDNCVSRSRGERPLFVRALERVGRG